MVGSCQKEGGGNKYRRRDALRRAGMWCLLFLCEENHWLGQWVKRRLLPIMKTEKLLLQKEVIPMENDNKSLSHTKWNCKYHIVFAPKYRRKVFFGEKRMEIGKN